MLKPLLVAHCLSDWNAYFVGKCRATYLSSLTNGYSEDTQLFGKQTILLSKKNCFILALYLLLLLKKPTSFGILVMEHVSKYRLLRR